MKCSLFRNYLPAFREETLSAELQHSAHLHLASCEECRHLLEAFNETESIIEHEKAVEPSPFAATRILQRIESEFEKANAVIFPRWIRVLQPVTIALALMCGILIGSYTANKEETHVDNLLKTAENIEFLRSNLFISEFADEDRNLGLNK